MNAINNVRFEDWEAEQMQDPEFQAAVEELEPAYQVARLRIRRGLTQKQLAKLVGTHQSSIARLESGNTQPRLSFLRRVVNALGARLEVRIVPREKKLPTRYPPIIIAAESDDTGLICIENWPLPKEPVGIVDWKGH
jgi:transcriptional regulator with XRE-family HTH domain